MNVSRRLKIYIFEMKMCLRVELGGAFWNIFSAVDTLSMFVVVNEIQTVMGASSIVLH